jgi:ATP-binding cassette subfamily F protein 3
MLTINNLSKSFGIVPLFENVNFTVNPHERVGLVGPNGCGKSTLLRIIAGHERPNSGSVMLSPANLRVGYLAQGLAFVPDDTLGSFMAREEGNLPALTQRLEELALALTNGAESSGQINDLQRAYDAVLSQITAAGENAGRAPVTLAALGLDDLDRDLPVSALSGGQKTRLALAGILLAAPQLMLLDEPTNHLDLEMLDWLENWLLDFQGAALVVSHDRAFLDRTTTAIIDMDPLTRTTRRYEGNYTFYLEEKLSEREKQWQSYKDQQDEIQRLGQAASRVRSRAKFHKGGKADIAVTDGFSVGHFMNRSKETIQKAKNIEKRIERLMGEDRIDKPGRTWQMKLEFGEAPPTGRDVLVLEDLAVGYGEHVLLSNLSVTVRYGERVAMVGPNGAGKTTLLRTITGQIPPLSGSVRLGSNVRLGYMSQEQEVLDGALTPLETIRKIAALNETGLRSFLSLFLFTGDDVFVPVERLSYGERSRLMLAGLVAQGCNFLLLDEPINHLDIPARARFEQALTNFEGTVLAVIHDRYFIEGFATHLWEVRSDRQQMVAL